MTAKHQSPFFSVDRHEENHDTFRGLEERSKICRAKPGARIGSVMGVDLVQKWLCPIPFFSVHSWRRRRRPRR